MQVDLARRQQQQQHQQRSNTNPNQYMNVSVPFTVSQSTASNYHLVSDPNGTNGNAMGTESDIYASDSASSSAASSFVHLPLAAVDALSSRSLLVRGGYDNVRQSFFSYFFWALDAPIIPFGIIRCHLWTTVFGFISAVTITAGYHRPGFILVS